MGSHTAASAAQRGTDFPIQHWRLLSTGWAIPQLGDEFERDFEQFLRDRLAHFVNQREHHF